MSYITNVWVKYKLSFKRFAWFVGLYAASLIVIGSFFYLGHFLITLLP